jgi:hypothetical protein
LPSHVRADGHPFTVRIVLVNNLGHSFPVPGRCNGWLSSGLASTSVDFSPMYTLVGCADDRIPPGVTTLTRTISTTYQRCTQSKTATDLGDVLCTGPNLNQIPRLPPGAYHLAMDTAPIPHLTIRTPLDLTLTP